MTISAYTKADADLYFKLVETIRNSTRPDDIQNAWVLLEQLKNQHGGHVPENMEEV